MAMTMLLYVQLFNNHQKVHVHRSWNRQNTGLFVPCFDDFVFVKSYSLGHIYMLFYHSFFCITVYTYVLSISPVGQNHQIVACPSTMTSMLHVKTDSSIRPSANTIKNFEGVSSHVSLSISLKPDIEKHPFGYLPHMYGARLINYRAI